MTPTEAFEFTLEKVIELKKDDIEVIIKPSKARNDEDTIRKYNKPDRLPPGKWIYVSFKFTNDRQAIKIFEAANYLGMCGIKFDTGGCSGQRDWELDWSFRYNKGEEDMEWMTARQEVENIIKDMCD